MAQAAAQEDRAGLGILMMLCAWALFTGVDTSAKHLAIAGLPALQIAWVRYAGAFAISVAVEPRSLNALRRVPRRATGVLALRAALLLSATVFNFIAVGYLPLAVTSSILFSSPILVCLLAGPMLGERPGPWRWAAIGVGFVGVLIVVRPFGAAFHWAMLLIVWNAFAMAIFSILTRRLSAQVPAQTMQLWLAGTGAVLLAPAALWLWTAPATPWDWAVLAGIGAFGWAGHEVFARAHSFAEASALMPWSYASILFMTLSGWLVFGDVPDGATALGAAVIVAAGLLIWARERRAAA